MGGGIKPQFSLQGTTVGASLAVLIQHASCPPNVASDYHPHLLTQKFGAMRERHRAQILRALRH